MNVRSRLWQDAGPMRIGELLVQQGKLRHGDLTRAVANQPESMRLCSYLIAQGLIDLDDGSRALGELHGVPCALAKHLEGRDPTIASVIPAELGRSSCALPIGKTSKGNLIVCVRDPAPRCVPRSNRRRAWRSRW